MNELVLNILKNSWPMIFIFATILVSIRIVYIFKNKEQFIFYKEVLGLFFVIYILCLFHVVTFQDVSWSTSNYIPFKEMFRYTLGSELFYRNVVGNMIMFVPYGLFLAYLFKSKNPILVSILALLTSATIEVTQLAIGRVFDIDDIILNVLGAIIGAYSFLIIRYVHDLLPSILKKQLFYNIIIIVFIFLVFIYFNEVILGGGLYG